MPALGGGVPNAATEALRAEMLAEKTVRIFLPPRGIGPTTWTGNAKRQIQIRRRFMLLGQTLEGMRVWDIRRAVQVWQATPKFKSLPLEIRARGFMAVNALYAGLFEPTVAALQLTDLPQSHRDGPDYLNVLQVWDLPDALALAGERVVRR